MTSLCSSSYYYSTEVPTFRAVARNLGIFSRSAIRLLNFAQPRKIWQSQSKKVVLHQHFFERVSVRPTAHICLHKEWN